MIRYKHYVLLITLIALSGCHLLAVGISGMPSWSCIRAKEPITLFRDLDMTGEVPQAITCLILARMLVCSTAAKIRPAEPPTFLFEREIRLRDGSRGKEVNLQVGTVPHAGRHRLTRKFMRRSKSADLFFSAGDLRL